MWRLIRGRTRATERDDEASEHWVKQRWPHVSKRPGAQHALIVCEDESGVSLRPVVRATWAPRGQWPVLRHRFD
jgi:hypothetical protein